MIIQKYEVAVIGGGMIGATTALGLAHQGFKVILVEKKLPINYLLQQNPDVRISAVSIASINLLNKLGVWENVLSMRAHPYHYLEAWDCETAHIIFSANELQLPLLGYMVENSVLQLALWKMLKSNSNVTLRVPDSLQFMYYENNQYKLKLKSGAILLAKLVVGADGSNSKVRKLSGIKIHEWQYAQHCMLITVRCKNKPGNKTWQKFTSSGPRAFLPLFDHFASLIWYDVPDFILQLKELSLIQLKKEITRNFPSRLGEIQPLIRKAFSLKRSYVFNYIQEGLVLVGDAAHTIHPLAGQGVNLGYRDVSTLLEVLSTARKCCKSWSNLEVLQLYQKRRMLDNLIMQVGIDLLHAGFNNSLAPVRFLYNFGILAVEHIGLIKRQILKYASGL